MVSFSRRRARRKKCSLDHRALPSVLAIESYHLRRASRRDGASEHEEAGGVSAVSHLDPLLCPCSGILFHHRQARAMMALSTRMPEPRAILRTGALSYWFGLFSFYSAPALALAPRRSGKVTAVVATARAPVAFSTVFVPVTCSYASPASACPR